MLFIELIEDCRSIERPGLVLIARGMAGREMGGGSGVEGEREEGREEDEREEELKGEPKAATVALDWWSGSAGLQ